MHPTIKELLDQKHLLNEIDLFIYSSFLQKEEIDELLELYKLKDCDLENLLNNLETVKGKCRKKLFINFMNIREKIRDKEKELFKRILEPINKLI